ncbi:AzlC family ABC transporter permease [Rhodalgimonas zhirmunskyi]|uniref:AzlC family ABC transporter permease n=1 Tax=Rhodalgimonas zhirmunskyi TaxID=2964767 RepID=A0AAJ1X3Q9_9RHOB|nr:AzlC family ABC transporter permease [Rhodoalgimonas zhirmunskyi]MDQ2093548.1 AzlC family ABC transporter permease [Rhodoalgimonas zhirmunskyi]
MPTTTQKSAFWKGFAAGAPFVIVVVPFAMLFGVVATEAGLDIFETFAFSTVVIAGAAQFTALQLMQDHAPVWVVLISALAVNLRLVMYSASLTPHLGALPVWRRLFVAYLIVDQSYACSVAAYEKSPQWPLMTKLAFFMGTCTPVLPLWIAGSVAGALLGQSIPPEFALDFAVPITFLAMLAPMLRTMAHMVAAVTAVVLALAFAGLPFNLGLLLAGLGGMIAGAEVERRVTRLEVPAQ